MADLKLKDLRYLATLAETRHFGQAAAACHVSQPTLSAQLKKLEDYLGVQLVERQPRNVTLTEAGEAIAARARQIMTTSDEIVRLAQGWRDPLAGRLRVALLPTIGPYLLPQVLAKLRKALPRLELMLYEYQTGPMLEHLQAGSIDVGILARGWPLPARPGARGVRAHAVAREAGLSRHEPRDLATDGSRWRWHHAVAGTGGARRLRPGARHEARAAREAGANAAHRRGLAHEHRAAAGDRSGLRAAGPPQWHRRGALNWPGPATSRLTTGCATMMHN